jgi:hypothetical protein
MRRLGSLVGLVVAAVLVLAGPGEVSAQTDAARATARERYAEAQRLFDSRQFAAAEAKFREAYAAVPNPVVLRAIAAAQEQQNNAAGAIATLQQYLRDAPNANDRAEVERRIVELGSRRAIITFNSAPPGAEIIVDGQPTGQRTPVEVQIMPGEHTLELRLQGYPPVSQRFTAVANTRVRLDVNIAQAQAMGANGGDGRVADPSGGGGGGGGSADPSIGVWISAGVAAAGLISGTVFGFLALSEQSNFDQMPTLETADRGEAFALVADISFGVAAAAAITGIVLYIVERSTAPRSQAGMLQGDRLQLGVAPWASPNGGGMAAQLRF